MGGSVHIPGVAGAGDDSVFALEIFAAGSWSQAQAPEQPRLAAIVASPMIHLIFMVIYLSSWPRSEVPRS